MKKRVKKKGQVWIETVVYTLIAFIILGAVLSFAKPKIEKLQDKSIIDQSIEMMENINNVLDEIKEVPGNKRQMELGIKKGELLIDSETNQIVFKIDSKYTYSEPGIVYKKGDIKIYNNQLGKLNKINASINYTGKYEIVWNNEEKPELLTQSSTAYNIFISNTGEINGMPIINFEFA